MARATAAAAAEAPATSPRRKTGAWLKRALFGDRPSALLFLLVPTALALVLDVVLRGRAFATWAVQGKLIYASSVLLSAAFWALPLWIASRLFLARAGRRRAAARAGIGVVFALWILPLATFCYAGQALYFRVFHAYVGRDTLRLGIALRGTVRDWFDAWGGLSLLAAMLAVGGLITLGLVAIVRRAAAPLAGTIPVVLLVTFAASLPCFWYDAVDSRFLQAATPDACFVHGAVHALRVAVTGQGRVRQGMSLRSPAPLPALTSARARPPNVIVVLAESVRADALCSEPPPACRAVFLDDVVPDRIALGKLTTQTPNTFSSFMLLTTGLAPNVDFRDAHTAPVLWEIAHAVGYRTAYVTSQNSKYEDFGAFVKRAGIDVLVTEADLGGMQQEQLGAPDERAAEEMLRFVRTASSATPYFAVLHLANTHAPYRVDPALQPFGPHADDPLGDVEAFHNHYRNSVRLEERTIAAFVRELRALPSWDDTVLLFLSDHGEQFREHGGLYHNHSLFEEEVRVPGWLVAGARALDADQRAAVTTYAGRRTYTQDVHATVVDLFGVQDARATLPLAHLVGGRSLVRVRVPADEPMALLATSTGVWEPDDARYGVMLGERLLVGAPAAAWICFDLARDPYERSPLAAGACGEMSVMAERAFAGMGVGR